MVQEEDIRNLYTYGRGYERLQWMRHFKWNYPLWQRLPGEGPEEAIQLYCRGFLKRSPDKVFVGADRTPYLSKYCIAEPLRQDTADDSGKIYLNHFHRGDEDQELHNHPWERSLSLILLNGYEEERRNVDGVARVTRCPGDIVEITDQTFHRVDTPFGEAWTLFFTGKYSRSWHFWNRKSHILTPWRDFLKAKGLSI